MIQQDAISLLEACNWPLYTVVLEMFNAKKHFTALRRQPNLQRLASFKNSARACAPEFKIVIVQSRIIWKKRKKLMF